MDLQTISSQMKVVIQKHQLVVTEMRNDPQNPVLQKRLNDLQLEIHSLNERQKQVVEDLRKNLEKKQSCPNSCSNSMSGFPAATNTHSLQTSNQEIRMVCCAQKCPMANHKLTTTTVATKPVANCVNTVRQTVPPTINNIATPTATFTFKAPVGTVVLPNCSTANALLSSKVAEHQKVHPVLVVPSPSNRSVDGPQTGVLLNLVPPPIRVPQYPPPLPRTPAPIKKEFITALGLVTRDSLSDIKNKKLERKRRSTANPQFSNAALEEKWRIAAAAQASAIPQKRPRGRPRLESKAVVSASSGMNPVAPNGLNPVTDNVKPCEVSPPPPPLNNSSVNSSVSSSSSPLNDTAAVVNGILRQTPNSDEGKNVEQMLSGLCIVCTQPGDLVKCDTCAKQQHPGCMQPPVIAPPQSPWQCSDCQSRTVSLTVVQSYDVLKAAKEDEKKKLLKKSLELRLKRSQLESRLLQLRELSNKQKNRQSELQTSLKGIETLLERIHCVINGVRLCS